MFLSLPVCVKSSEVLFSLVSCTINLESVLNLRSRKTDWLSRCLLHLCHLSRVMSVVLFNVLQRRSPARGDDWPGILRQQYCTSSAVNARAHSFCSVPYSCEFFQLHGLSLRVRTGNTLQNELSMAPLQC